MATPMSIEPDLSSPRTPSRVGPHPRHRPHGSVLIRTATSRDLPATARLHRTHLPTGLFPQLGERFLNRWHAAFLDSSSAVSLVAVERTAEGEQCIGFLIGTLDRAAFRREVLSMHRSALVARGVVALGCRPAVLTHFVRTRLRPYLQRLSNGVRPIGPDACSGRAGDLSAVAVDTVRRGAGVGSSLAQEFIDRCALAGTPWIELVAAIDPPSAAAFYDSTGWTPLRESTTRDGVIVRHYGRGVGGSGRRA